MLIIFQSEFTFTYVCENAASGFRSIIASFISGKGKDTDLSFGAGAIRSIQRRRARPSPSNAFEIAVCVRASAWPSSKLSMASVFLFRAPLGLPVLPEVNLPAAVFLPFLMLKLFLLTFSH